MSSKFETYSPTKYSYFMDLLTRSEFRIAPHAYSMWFSSSPPTDLELMDSIERYAFDPDSDCTIEVIAGLQRSRLEPNKFQLVRLCTTVIDDDGQSMWITFSTLPDGLPGLIPSETVALRKFVNHLIRQNSGELPTWTEKCLRACGGFSTCVERATGESLRAPKSLRVWKDLFSSHKWMEIRMTDVVNHGKTALLEEGFMPNEVLVGPRPILDGQAISSLFDEEEVDPANPESPLATMGIPVAYSATQQAFRILENVTVSELRELNEFPIYLSSLCGGLQVLFYRSSYLKDISFGNVLEPMGEHHIQILFDLNSVPNSGLERIWGGLLSSAMGHITYASKYQNGEALVILCRKHRRLPVPYWSQDYTFPKSRGVLLYDHVITTV